MKIRKEKINQILVLLEKRFGVPERKRNINPLDSLISTILSQNTNDKNRDQAYKRLRDRFATWEQVMQANVKDIEAAIRPAGLGRQKSERIKDILLWIHQTFGKLNIDFLCQMNPQQAIDLFCTQKGIGIKTIAVVLLFSCGIDVFPVDTHVHRICRRLALVPWKTSAEKTYWLMQDYVPDGKSYSFHLNLLKLGRTICLTRNPHCDECPLTGYCYFYKTAVRRQSNQNNQR